MEFRLPDLGDDAGKSARVSFWYCSAGENVEEGQDVVEMMTDKATFNVPSPATGVLTEVRVKEDETAAVGDVLGIIEST
jgi:pyruvate/2-oxoglutarate dehydrogenase complex dihydrolipoamide acyltransferase (E2) component